MPTPITVRIETITLTGTLNDSPAALALAKTLPLSCKLSRWGEEYYGAIPGGLGVKEDASAREVLEIGELAYWPPGSALCVFWGATPASQGDECRAASPVLPLGQVTGDWTAVSQLGGTVNVRVEAA